MSFVKIRSAARSASLPLNSHLRSGDSSQIPTSLRTALCSATGSPNWLGQYQPSQSMNSQPSSRWTRSKAVLTISVVLIGTPPGALPPSDVFSPVRILPSQRARDRGSVPEERLECGVHRRVAEARGRSLEAEDALQLAVRAEDRRRDRVQLALALAGGTRVPAPAHALDLRLERLAVDDRP